MVASLRTIALSVLIESDWNLKQATNQKDRWHSRINRIRLEFKEGYRLDISVVNEESINRIRLEFKADRPRSVS